MSENDEVAETAQDEAWLMEALQAAFRIATAIPPARGGAASANDVELCRVALDKVAALTPAALEASENSSATEEIVAIVYARCAAVAIAASDDAHAELWLNTARKFAASDELKDELIAASNHPERYRQLVHARYQVANHDEGSARTQWKQLVKAGPDDAITRAAATELQAPRPLRDGDMPSLWNWYGVGVGFYGSRDAWPDGSYVTTHCFSVLWIPLIPMRSYRVYTDGEGYVVTAREQLSGFARWARRIVVLGAVTSIVALVLSSHFNDPSRLARKRFDYSLEKAETADPEKALRILDEDLSNNDVSTMGASRFERAGAAIVRITAKYAPKPFTVANLDQAGRLVRRFQGLPPPAQGGVAREAALGVLDGWIAELGDKLDTADARLSLLRHEAAIAGALAGSLESRITTTRLAVAQAKEADWPLDALAILVAPPSIDTIARANKIVDSLADSPSLLVDAGGDLDAWLAATTNTALRTAITGQRALAMESQTALSDDKLTAAKLAEMAKKRPWDQQVVLRQARDEVDANKLAPAAARLAKLGKPGRMIREARLLLGQVSSALGKLDEADVLLSSLLGARLERFVAASAKFHEAAKAAETRVLGRLDTGDIPYDVRSKYESALDDGEKRTVIDKFIKETMTADSGLVSARDAYVALSDIVPVSLAAGTVKLRRAQAMPEGPARSAMLVEAERTFLAIRAEAEGQPEFRIGLGEIYARLGKVAESEAEFAALLQKNDPQLSLLVARTYRAIGSVERAKLTAQAVYDNPSATVPIKSAAAVQLGLLTTGDEDESERWYRKADPSIPFVRTSLLEIEGHRLQRQGKRAECAAKFAQAAREHLAQATPTSTDAYNNVAVAHLSRFRCTGDMQALADASAAFEKAYRANRESAIVVGNFSETLSTNGRLRVLAKRIDLRAFQPMTTETNSLIQALLDSPEREAVLKDLTADPDIRRGEQVFGEYEVLAPNSPRPYRVRFDRAYEHRDDAAGAAVVDRARKAKALDVSENESARKQWLSGGLDGKLLEAYTSRLAQLDAIVAGGRLDPKTRAAVQFVIASSAIKAGLFKANPALIKRGREAAVVATNLWPALATNSLIAIALIDEAALAVDGKAWVELRRSHPVGAALGKFGDGLKKIKGSPQWAEVLTHLRADTSRPGVDDLRIARLLGDAGVEARVKAVLDDKLARLNVELSIVLDPADPMSKVDLALLDRR